MDLLRGPKLQKGFEPKAQVCVFVFLSLYQWFLYLILPLGGSCLQWNFLNKMCIKKLIKIYSVPLPLPWKNFLKVNVLVKIVQLHKVIVIMFIFWRLPANCCFLCHVFNIQEVICVREILAGLCLWSQTINKITTNKTWSQVSNSS